MPAIEHRIEIKAPPAFVFAALTDPLRAPEWNSNVLEVKNVSGIPLGEGTTWQQVTVMMGKAATLNCRIASFEPPTSGLLELSGPYAAKIWTVCEPSPDGTQVLQRIDFVPPGGLLGGMAAKVIQPLLAREIAQTMERQRQILEREAGAGHGSEPT